MLNNPIRYTDPTGHSIDCAIGEQYCNAGKLDVNKRAQDLALDHKLREKNRGSRIYWSGLSNQDQSVLAEGSFNSGAYNDYLDDASRHATLLEDPAFYLSLGVSGGIKLLLGLVSGACANGACTNIRAGTTVYRVWGSDPNNPGLPGSGPWGRSWSPVDPSTIENFRNLAGIPSGGESGVFNTARFVSIGEIVDPSGIIVRQALSLDGQAGGLLEYIISDPQVQVLLKFVGGVNPPY